MSQTTAPATVAPEAPKKSDGTVTVLGILVIVAGIVLMFGGVMTWTTVSSHLVDERIIVADDAASQAGSAVTGPLQAYAEAEIIQKHALEATKGKTYAELDREDPLRQTAMTGSFLRASLFTSVVSFGIAAMAAGLGLVNILIGAALIKVARI